MNYVIDVPKGRIWKMGKNGATLVTSPLSPQNIRAMAKHCMDYDGGNTVILERWEAPLFL